MPPVRRLITLAIVGLPGALTGQAPPGAALWRVASQTVAQPPALAESPLAAFWNPALAERDGGRVTLALEAIHGAEVTGVAGALAGVRVRAGQLGHLGLLVGRMAVGDLVRTSSSPAPEPGEIPFHAAVYGATLSVTPIAGRLHFGLTALAHRFALDVTTEHAWTLDGGVWYQPFPRLSLGAATHFLSRAFRSHPQQDVWGAANWDAWRGTLGSGGRGAPAILHLRAGIAGAHGGGLDQQFGAGLSVGEHLDVDALLVREDRYGNVAVRGVVGVSISTGHYRVTFARDNGMNDLGAAFRFGLEAMLK